MIPGELREKQVAKMSQTVKRAFALLLSLGIALSSTIDVALAQHAEEKQEQELPKIVGSCHCAWQAFSGGPCGCHMHTVDGKLEMKMASGVEEVADEVTNRISGNGAYDGKKGSGKPCHCTDPVYIGFHPNNHTPMKYNEKIAKEYDADVDAEKKDPKHDAYDYELVEGLDQSGADALNLAAEQAADAGDFDWTQYVPKKYAKYIPKNVTEAHADKKQLAVVKHKFCSVCKKGMKNCKMCTKGCPPKESTEGDKSESDEKKDTEAELEETDSKETKAEEPEKAVKETKPEKPEKVDNTGADAQEASLSPIPSVTAGAEALPTVLALSQTQTETLTRAIALAKEEKHEEKVDKKVASDEMQLVAATVGASAVVLLAAFVSQRVGGGSTAALNEPLLPDTPTDARV